MVVNKEQKSAVVIDAAIPSDATSGRKHEKLEKYQGINKKLDCMWKVKSTVVPVVT
ncbi:hypothetical protein LDENG_00265180 [Lucifuga dentata]|nr:hypothetical protein LDENG_00265180 [Lucifuga dentata]